MNLPMPPAPDGYRLVPLHGRWAELSHDDCGNVTEFVNATTHRLAWFVSSHRCGPLGSGWQEGGPTARGGPVLRASIEIHRLHSNLDRVLRLVHRGLEADQPDLAAIVAARLTDATAHLAAALDALSAEGDDR